MTGETQASAYADQTLPYAASVTLVEKSSGFANWFTNTHVTLCGAITSCEIKASGCSSAYTAGNLAITANTGAVTAKQNVDAGYEDTVCIRCTNGHSSAVD